jgi:hypothetical protein
MVNIDLLNLIRPESESLIRAGVRPEALRGRKGDSSDALSEVSGTVRQLADKRGIELWMSVHINTKFEQN